MLAQQEDVLTGRIWVLGFGAVAKTLIPMLLNDLSISPKQIHVLSDQIAIEAAVPFVWKQVKLNQQNYQDYLRLQTGDIVLNLATQLCSKDLIRWCWQCGAMYLDTCVEPWSGGYEHDDLLKQTNAWLRRDVLSLNQHFLSPQPTALIAHGANPGLVSHFLKQALDILADQRAINKKQSHAAMARDLGVKVIHISERDTQNDSIAWQAGEFVNTWSVNGLLTELKQPIEMGLGSHEKHNPQFIYPEPDAASVYIDNHNKLKKVRTWVPSVGQQTAWMITHHEAISIASYLTDFSERGVYRPSVYYAYHPSPKTLQSIDYWVDQGQQQPETQRILEGAHIEHGFDELGVLIMGDNWGYWYGSHLSIDQVNCTQISTANATTVQVAAGIMAGLNWMWLNPNQGVVEAEQIDSAFVLKEAEPYLGRLFGVDVPSAFMTESMGLSLCDFEII